MKIRNGFVSNSSSSSFLLKANSTMEIFCRMLPLLKKDYEFDDEAVSAWNKYHAPRIEKFLKKYPKDFNGGIRIPFTCNFETYIYPVDGGESYIETCNNIDWSEIFASNELTDLDDCDRYGNDEITQFVDVSTLKTNTSKGFYKEMCEEWEKKYSKKTTEPVEKTFEEKIEDCITKTLSQNSDVPATGMETSYYYLEGFAAGLSAALRMYKNG